MTPFNLCFLQLTFTFATLDYDECRDDPEAGCTQFCHNFIGGYYCSCRHGYHLTEDQRTCTGTNARTGNTRTTETGSENGTKWRRQKWGREGEEETRQAHCLRYDDEGSDDELFLGMQCIAQRICRGCGKGAFPAPPGRLLTQWTPSV